MPEGLGRPGELERAGAWLRRHGPADVARHATSTPATR